MGVNYEITHVLPIGLDLQSIKRSDSTYIEANDSSINFGISFEPSKLQAFTIGFLSPVSCTITAGTDSDFYVLLCEDFPDLKGHVTYSLRRAIPYEVN